MNSNSTASIPPRFLASSSSLRQSSLLGSLNGKLASVSPWMTLGELAYRPAPRLEFIPSVHHISVRSFVTPGWSWTLALRCVGCTGVGHVALRPLSRDCKMERDNLQVEPVEPVATGGGASGANANSNSGGDTALNKPSEAVQAANRMQAVS